MPSIISPITPELFNEVVKDPQQMIQLVEHLTESFCHLLAMPPVMVEQLIATLQLHKEILAKGKQATSSEVIKIMADCSILSVNQRLALLVAFLASRSTIVENMKKADVRNLEKFIPE